MLTDWARRQQQYKSVSSRIPKIFRTNAKGDFDSAALLDHILSKPKAKREQTDPKV